MSLRAYLLPLSLGLAAGWAVGWWVPSPWLPGRAGFAAPPRKKTVPASSKNDPKAPGVEEILTGPPGAARLARLAEFLPQATAVELERLAHGGAGRAVGAAGSAGSAAQRWDSRRQL